MSEYNFTLQPSKQQWMIRRGFVGLCLLSVWLWPNQRLWSDDGVWSVAGTGVLAVQVLLSLGLVRLFLALKPQLPGPFEALSVSPLGEVNIVAQGQSYQILPNSVVSDWFCYVLLQPTMFTTEVFTTERTLRRIWLFRDSLDDNSYRRLCRIIYRIRRHGHH